MLTYLETVIVAALERVAFQCITAGHIERPRVRVPAGRYDVYRQAQHKVFVPAGQDPHDYDGTFYYCGKNEGKLQ